MIDLSGELGVDDGLDALSSRGQAGGISHMRDRNASGRTVHQLRQSRARFTRFQSSFCSASERFQFVDFSPQW